MPKTMTMTASASLTYAGKKIAKGADFEATPSDARVLVAVRKAVYRTRMLTAEAYETKVMKAETTRKTLSLPETAKRAPYVRRAVENE